MGWRSRISAWAVLPSRAPRTEDAMAEASLGGTALPICWYLLEECPANRNLSGRVGILAASRMQRVRSSRGRKYQYPSFAIWAVMVRDKSSKERRRYLSSEVSHLYLLRCPGTSRYVSPGPRTPQISLSSGRFRACPSIAAAGSSPHRRPVCPASRAKCSNSPVPQPTPSTLLPDITSGR